MPVSKYKTISIQVSYIACVVFTVFLFGILFYSFTELLSLSIYDVLLIIWPVLLLDLGRNIGKAVVLPIDVILRTLEPPPEYFKPRLISIIIPAKNEEENIGECIKSILENNYQWKEIIVVDDGSEDNTYLIARHIAKKHEGMDIVKVVRKESSGYRASPINYGLLFARGEIVFTVDADTLVGRDSLEWVARYFEDERLVAGAGNLRVLNRDINLLTKLQAYEYFMSFEIGRRTQSLLRTLLIIPGASSIYRRSVLESLGRLDHVLTEDFDTTLKFHKIRGKLIFIPEVLSWTDVPLSWGKWFKQRIRWSRGQLYSLRKHSQLFFRRRFGMPGLIGAPDMVLMDITILFAWFIWLIWVILARIPIHTLFMLLTPILLYSELLVISTSRIVSKVPEPFSILILFPLVAFFYRPLHSIARYIGYLYEVLGKRAEW